MAFKVTNTKLGQTFDLVSGYLELPIQGIWTLWNVNIDNGDLPFSNGDPITVEFLGKNLVGTFVDAVNYDGKVTGTIIGGKGTLANIIESTSYIGVSVRSIVSFIAAKTGHSIDPSSDAKLLSTSVQRFEKVTSSASAMLSKVLSPYNAIWRVTPSGTIYIGYEQYPDMTIKFPTLIPAINFDILDKQQALGYWRVYTEDTLIEPAFSISGNNVKEVIYDLNVDSNGITIRLDFNDPAHIIDYQMASESRDTIFHRKYRMKVSVQKADGTVTLFPDPDNILFKTGLRDVPIVYPLPGMKIKVQPGAICYVEFANGDPGLPIISSWDDKTSASLVEIIHTNALPAARKGDTVDCGKLTLAVAAGVLSGLYVYPVSTPPHVPPQITVTPGTPFQLTGVIDKGSSIVSIGT